MSKLLNRAEDTLKDIEYDVDRPIPKELASKLAEAVENLKKKTGDVQAEAAQEVMLALSLLEKPTVWRRIATGQTIFQLLNPKTIGRNVIGNELFYRMERLAKLNAAIADVVISKATGRERTTSFVIMRPGETHFWRSFFEGSGMAWRGLQPGNLETQFSLGTKGPAFRGKYNPLTYMEKSLGATLRGFDYAAYSRAKYVKLRELAEVRAINRKLEGGSKKRFVEDFMQNADEVSVKIADAYGKYVTFNDETVLAQFLSSTKTWMNKISTGTLSGEFGAGDLLLKYPKTPANLIMRAIDYSPAGVIRGMVILADGVKAKHGAKGIKGESLDPGALTMQLSRAITGTMGFTALGMFLLAKGVLTADRDKDPDLRVFREEQTGERSYQVNVSAIKRWVMSGFREAALEKRGDDILVSYDWAQPLAVSIAMGAQIRKNRQEGRGKLEGVGDAIVEGIGAGIQTIAEQPLLQGLQNVFGSRYSNDKLRGFVDALEGAPSSFVPTIVNQVRQLTDNTRRITDDPEPWQRAINKVLYRFPVFSKALPAAYEALGEEFPKEVYQDGRNTLFNVLVNPTFVSTYKVNEMAVALMRPYEQEGRTKQFPRVIDKERNLKVSAKALNEIFETERFEEGTTIRLTGEDQSWIQRRLGALTARNLSRPQVVNIDGKETKVPPATQLHKAGFSFKDQEKFMAKAVNDAWEETLSLFAKSKGRGFFEKREADLPKRKKAQWIEDTPAFSPLISEMEKRLKSQLSPTDISDITVDEIADHWHGDATIRKAIQGVFGPMGKEARDRGVTPEDVMRIALKRSREGKLERPLKEAADD